MCVLVKTMSSKGEKNHGEQHCLNPWLLQWSSRKLGPLAPEHGELKDPEKSLKQIPFDLLLSCILFLFLPQNES